MIQFGLLPNLHKNVRSKSIGGCFILSGNVQRYLEAALIISKYIVEPSIPFTAFLFGVVPSDNTMSKLIGSLTKPRYPCGRACPVDMFHEGWHASSLIYVASLSGKRDNKIYCHRLLAVGACHGRAFVFFLRRRVIDNSIADAIIRSSEF